jgi:hypothetical protein
MYIGTQVRVIASCQYVTCWPTGTEAVVTT